MGLGENFRFGQKIVGLGEKNLFGHFMFLHLNFAFAFCIPRQKFRISKKIWTDRQTDRRHTQNQWPPLLHYGLDRQVQELPQIRAFSSPITGRLSSFFKKMSECQTKVGNFEGL